MQPQRDSDAQEPVRFGSVNPLAAQQSTDTAQPSIEQETPATHQVREIVPIIANYGPCVMCGVNERCILFVGCNHLACCNQCSTRCNNRCPVSNCNHPIEGHLHVFKP